MVTVSSDFQAELESKTPAQLGRKFTIGSSDYSERVLKWPSASWSVGDIRPKNLVINLTNSDNVFSFFRDDKTSMQTECKVFFSYGEEGSLAPVEINSSSIEGSTFLSPDVVKGVHVTSGGLHCITAVNGIGVHEVKKYTMSPAYDITGMTLNQTLDLDPLTNVLRGLSFTEDGTRLYITEITNTSIMEFSLSSAWDLTTVVNTQGYDLSAAVGITDMGGCTVNSDASMLWLTERTAGEVHEFSMSTPGDLSTCSPTSATLDVSSYNNTPEDVVLTTDLETMLILNREVIMQAELSTPGDLSTATLSFTSVYETTVNSGAQGIGLFPDHSGFILAPSTNYTLDQYSLPVGVSGVEELVMFQGNVGEIKYNKEICTVRLIDKFRDLSDRTIGTPTEPAAYITSDHLGSDLAWYICTSHGGLSSVESSSNEDIDFNSFSDWASVFSGDQIRMRANFEGQTCTELLRKIAKHTSSTVYVREGKLFFKRLSIAETVVNEYDTDNTFNVALSFRTDDLINTQQIAGGFTANSGHTFTITQQNDSSVNSFGPKEDLLKDDNVWFVTSGTAINHAQRILYFNSKPDDKLEVQVPLSGALRSVGETVTIVDSFHALSDDYLIDANKINMETGVVDFSLTKILLQNPFILDTTSLGSLSEVLT